MKKTINVLLIAGATLFTYSAEAQKIGHINLDSLMRQMPEFDSAKKVGQAHYMELENEVESMNKEYQTKVDDYKAHQAGWSELVKNTKQDEIQQLGQRIQGFQQNASQDIQKFQDSITRPIILKAHKAVNDVAKEHHFSYVLDTSGGMVIYFEPTDDIYDLVADKLGLKAKKTK
jgi:outer membrane protein